MPMMIERAQTWCHLNLQVILDETKRNIHPGRITVKAPAWCMSNTVASAWWHIAFEYTPRFVINRWWRTSNCARSGWSEGRWVMIQVAHSKVSWIQTYTVYTQYGDSAKKCIPYPGLQRRIQIMRPVRAVVDCSGNMPTLRIRRQRSAAETRLLSWWRVRRPSRHRCGVYLTWGGWQPHFFNRALKGTQERGHIPIDEPSLIQAIGSDVRFGKIEDIAPENELNYSLNQNVMNVFHDQLNSREVDKW